MTVVTDYTLNQAAKTITLGTDFASTTIEQILSIRNLTKNIEIYDSRDPRKHQMFLNTAGMDISLLAGVITYIETATMANTDDIFILLDTSSDAVSISSTADLFTAESVAASSSATCEASIATGQLSKLSVYVANAGTSTSVTVSIWGSPTSSLTGRKKLLGTFTLGASAEAGNGIDSSQIDNYTWASIVNSDSENAATITVSLSMFR